MQASEYGEWSKEQLEGFLQRVPSLNEVPANNRELVAFLGYFVEEVVGIRDITPRRLNTCYEMAAMRAPANMSATMSRSGAFVRTTQGTALRREVKARIRAALTPESLAVRQDATRIPEETHGSREVVVVHGRDLKIRDSMFDFLRALGLHPREWGEAIRRTGHGAPFIGQVVQALFEGAQAIVVILSPDEHVSLRDDLRGGNNLDDEGWQPRPNVFLEAGMALSTNERRTIIVEVGTVRPATDLLGRHSVKLDDSPEKRNALAQRLSTAGCPADTTGEHWLRAGRFRVETAHRPTGKRKRA